MNLARVQEEIEALNKEIDSNPTQSRLIEMISRLGELRELVDWIDKEQLGRQKYLN